MLVDGSVVDGRYRILRPLGGGAMGKVYLSEKVTTHERFAIKFVHDYLVSDETYYARFEREINALRGIRHPHVVSVFDWKLPERGSGGHAYIVMEYLPGETMQHRLMRQATLPVELVMRIMMQVLDGLAAVHSMGIIHRDLSPANIFLVGPDPDFPSARIVDFGLAKGEAAASASDSQGGVTQDGAVLGRAAYAAPEMFLSRELDARADIFGCGMIMYRSLAGRFPYRESKTELMWVERYSQRHDDVRGYPSARSFKPSIPASVDQIISVAIRKRPQERYQTAEDMLRDLVKVEELLRLTPKLTGGHSLPEPLPALNEPGPAMGTVRPEAAPAPPPVPPPAPQDAGSPTPGPTAAPAPPSTQSGMPSVTNWLTQDESHPSAGAASSSAVRARRKARRSLGMRLLAASLVFAGLVAVVLAVLLQSGGGGPGPLSADAPAPGTVVGLGSSAADGADRVSVDARAVPRDATAPLPDAGPPPDRPTGTGQDAAAAPVDAGAAEPPTALVTISLAGLPDGAEAFVAGVKAVDGVAQVPRSDEPVALKATAPGFLDFETTLVPAEDMIFLVPMDPAPAPPVDAGTDVRPGRDARVVVRRDVVTTVRRDDAATTTVRRDDAGTTTVRPDDAATTRRDDGGASATRRDDGGRRGPDIPIIINYGREP